eukprot:gene12950-14282_t
MHDGGAKLLLGLFEHILPCNWITLTGERSKKAMSMPHSASQVADTGSQGKLWSHYTRRQLLSSKVDWTTSAVNGAHIWVDSELSGCHIQDCKKNGPRKKCASCKILVHEKCIEELEKINSCKCRPTFVEGSTKGTRQPYPLHHVAHRRKQDGRCDICGKYFQSKLSFQSGKDMIAVNCSWCKKVVHNKPECSRDLYMDDRCTLGLLENIIVRPSWIVKLPPRKYSSVQNGRQRKTTRRRSSRERRAFVIKSGEEGSNNVPLIVFVNPKSGGNQGARIMEKFQWLLNPRQVFDLMSDGGPRFGLELYRKVPNLRILVCGGDGSVGWVLSEIDRLKMIPAPPVAILPLGTGNDLSRFLGWGSGYTDEPLSRVLKNVEVGNVEKFDRWNLDVRQNPSMSADRETGDDASSKLPLNVMNNYFSLGADADVCLEFHESREANPDKFTSRLRNLMFYGKAGGRQFLQSKFKDLHKCIDQLLCDGKDLTERIHELKPVCLLFLNISKYSAGTSPWGHPTGQDFLPQSCNDGYLEVIGFTSTSMVATQVGGHGVRIDQCSQAILVTNKSITMQVDGGEFQPCRLKGSRIHIKQRNQSNMVFRRKHQQLYSCKEECLVETPPVVNIKIYYLTFMQYDKMTQYDIEEVKSIAVPLLSVPVNTERPLEELRSQIEKLRNTEETVSSTLADQWCFLDATWTTRIYRIDEAQENLMLVGDVIQDGIYVLDLTKRDPAAVDQFPLPGSPNSVWTKSPTQQRISDPPRRVSSPTLFELDNMRERMTAFENKMRQSNDSSTADISEDDISESSDDEDTSDGEDAPPLSPMSPYSPMTETNGMFNGTEFLVPSDAQQKKKLLLSAARIGDLDRFITLQQNDASMISCDSRGYTSLHLASKYGHKEIVKFFVTIVPQCVLDLVDHDKGQTALHKAASYKRRTICRLLINAGASLTRQDLEGNTPRTLALKSHDKDLAKYLENQERLQIIASDDRETAGLSLVYMSSGSPGTLHGPAGLINKKENMNPEMPSKAFVPGTSPLGLAIRDPGVLTKNQSFTETDFAQRHTVDSGIGGAYGDPAYGDPAYGDVALAGKGRENRRHHRHHHHHHHHHGDKSDRGNKDGKGGHRERRHSSSSNAGSTRRRSRSRSVRQADRPVTPPGKRVQTILGEDFSKEGIEPRPLFSEMEELLYENGEPFWKETARWVKFEEDVEESGNRFTKPHVGTLSLHALFELRSFLLNGALLFDMEGSTLDQISSIIVDKMISCGNLPLKLRDKVKAIILKRHRHVFEKKKDDDKGAERSKSEPNALMRLPIIRSFSRPNFSDVQAAQAAEQDLMNDPYLLGKGNINFMRKIPQGAEASNILVGEADFLTNPVSVFVRLSESHELGDLTEVPVPTRFIFLLLGTVGNLAKYHEIGRAVGTLMSDEVFHELAYKAQKREHLIAGIDEFLDSVTVLPPGEWDPTIRIEPPDNLPSQEGRKYGPVNGVCVKVDEEEEERKLREDTGLVRTGRPFGGLIADVRRRKPWYISDFKDSLSPQCIASWLFLYFGCLTPIVTFGGLLGDATKQRLASIESLVAGLVCGVGYGLFSGQPLTILGSTGPVLVFETILFEFCETMKWDYLSFRLWTGLWIGVILILLVAFDASAFVCYITRFTEENFATLIALIFMVEAFDKLFKIQNKYPIHPPADGMNCFCKPPSNQTMAAMYSWPTIPISNCTVLGGSMSGGCAYRPNVFFMSTVLFILTVLITFKLKGFKEAPFFPTILRRGVSDFAVIISILSMTLLDYFVKIDTPKLIVPATFSPTWSGRKWLIPILNGNPWWTILAAVIPALLATILIFMDQQITAVIVNRRENKLKKGCGYHLDLFVVSILIVICSVLGLPFFVAATVLSVNHVSSLTLESETAAPGEKPKFLGVLEQRVTQLLIFTTIGISVFLVPLLRLIPMPVLYGIFLYMGAASLKGLQFVDRMLIMLMPSKYQPDLPFLRKVPIKRVHMFTLVQLFCLVLLWVIKSIKATKMLFPIMLVVMIVMRKALDRYFTRQELKSLDDILPEFKRKERDEEEDDDDDDDDSGSGSEISGDDAVCYSGNSENVESCVSPDGQADLQIAMKSGNIMRISVPLEINISEEVKRCGVWKTVNSSNELVDHNAKGGSSHGDREHKHGSNGSSGRAKKSKHGKRKHSRPHSSKHDKLTGIEEEAHKPIADDDGSPADSDRDEEDRDFITIKIDKSKATENLEENSLLADTDECPPGYADQQV